jgi:2-keto-4-pentenoate hydratase
MHNIKAIAKTLRQADKNKEACSPIREIIGVEDIKTAYAIQNINNKKRLKSGARIVGRKIGLTSKAVQKQLGVDQPDYGALFHDMEVLTGGIIPWNETMQPKVEAEIAFVLARDLPSADIGVVDILAAIDYALVSLEIVGSRIENWNIKITDTIADNASASHFVLGHQPAYINHIDLINCKMKMTKNGETVSEGTGAACLGSPINATLWLAQTMAKLGTPLKAGEIILSGALGAMANAEAGDQFSCSIEGLGAVSVGFGE